MKTLLWKDVRVNRVVLLYTAVSISTSYLIMIGINIYVRWRYGMPFKEWTVILPMAAAFAMGFALPAAAMLGGCAFAAERADRSAEFLAYLPISRGKTILSKTTLAFGVPALAWIANSIVIIALAPPDDVEFRRMIWMMGAISFCMFGTAWFTSACSNSHALSAAVSVLATLAVTLGMFGVASLMEWPEASVQRWMPRILTAVGVLGYLIGARYYALRVEP